MPLSYRQAEAQVTAPGQPLEIAPLTVSGIGYQAFVNAPPSLRQLFDGARAYGERTYLVYEDERWSFAEVMGHVDALGRLLVERYGVGHGDRVAIGMRNYPEWVVSFAAITSIGAVSVSLNAWWSADELDFALSDSTPSVLVADGERARRSAVACARLGIQVLVVRSDERGEAGEGKGSPGAEGPGSVPDRWEDLVRPGGAALPAADIDPDDDATILYTSGTTGRPKGAVSTHRAVVQALTGFACRNAIEAARGGEPATEAEEAALILVVPLFHVTGSVPVMLSTFAFGIKLVMMHRWSPERALELIERERVTTFVGVPTQSWDLLESPRFADHDTSSLRSIGGGGAPAPPALVARVASNFVGGSPAIGYGLTETNGYGPGNGGADYLSRPTSTGRTTPIVEVEIRDAAGRPVATGASGEVWMKGPNLIRGYWNRPHATAEVLVEGWLRSGDLGHLDAEGFLYLEDRIKDMILRAGENVYCAEVEAAIYEHPAVHEAAVFGLPDERLGEEVAAVVVPRAGSTAEAAALAAHVGERLAAFKVPSRIFVVAEPLPRNAAGKILKRQLRSSFATSPGVP